MIRGVISEVYVRWNSPKTPAVGMVQLVFDRRNGVWGMIVFVKTTMASQIDFAANRRICSWQEVPKAACPLADWKVGYERRIVDGGFLLTNLMVTSDF